MASFEERKISYSKNVQTSSKRGWTFSKRINNNAYELDLPSSYNIRNFFNVSDLSPFDIGLKNLWSNSLQEGEDDEDVSTSSSSKDAHPRRIIRSMTKGNALSSLSLFCITLASILVNYFWLTC